MAVTGCRTIVSEIFADGTLFLLDPPGQVSGVSFPLYMFD
jgi:hypothetical protein